MAGFSMTEQRTDFLTPALSSEAISRGANEFSARFLKVFMKVPSRAFSMLKAKHLPNYDLIRKDPQSI